MLNYSNRYRLISKYEAKYDKSIDELNFKIPPVGSYIIYNEVERNKSVGCQGATRRGIGKVVKYTDYLIYIEVYLTPSYMRYETFQISDIVIGLLQWRLLKEKLLTKKYTYAELSIDSLHEDINSLIVE